MQIANDTVVSFNYQLRNQAGEVLDASPEGQPLTYLHGASHIIPGLEQRLNGHQTGDKVDVEVPPAEAYGEHDPDLMIAVPRDAFDPETPAEAFQPGTMFAGPHPKDEQQQVQYRIVEVTDDAVHATGNHPLAGETLFFSVEITEVREATDADRQPGQAAAEGADSGESCDTGSGCC